MNSTWLEQTRFPLQSIEALERAIVKQMFLKIQNPKDSVIIDNKINIFIKMIQQKSKQALQQFKDQDNLKKQQLAIISGQKNLPSIDKSKAPNIWQNFYQKMKELKELHKKFTPVIDPPKNTVDYFNKIVFTAPYKQPEFSIQQSKGKFVDMHSLYVEYLNVYKALNFKQDQKFGDYLWYLQNFDKFDEIPVQIKLKNLAKYISYLKSLTNYLYNYLTKVRPLINIDLLINQYQIDFVDKYEKGAIAGWQKSKEQQKEDKSVYCVNCKKMFINEDTYVNHLHGKKHLKAAKMEGKQKQGQVLNQQEQQIDAKTKFKNQQENKRKQLALSEYKIMRLRDQLANILYDTMNLIRKKQTRGYQEQQQLNQQSEQSQVDPDEPVYNPKNLPLGWDGKPIPYWLYKLHGLGVEYKCQICGNYSYWGRRSFEMHFQQWRHTYGMKCLRIPNTIHFKDVTTINDALALHQKLLAEAQASQFRPDMEEQFQDTEGNIINRKTYHDMKKQGIL